MLSPDSPVGIFDSGIGGLTVVRAMQSLLPSERIIYFGDTARVPYGTKSQVTICRYAHEDTRILMRHQPKLIIIACNTVSALALNVVENSSNGLPVLGVLEAGAGLAVERTRNGRIGVIGTQATICSNAYACAIGSMAPDAEVYSRACPLFVPLAEEGFIDHPATKMIAEEYLEELLVHDIDTLVLGCTHYPILKAMIREITGPDVTIIDSAEAVAESARTMLAERGLLSTATETTPPHLLVSDLPQKFQSLYRLFLRTSEVPDVELVGTE
ncbi:glutamate racemase [Prosthecochloris sp. N3]|uniref:Glutamate racemase n=1 Tax=Prosthecochloris ethylica TaxID=2743976 RepID=A0ABR9XUM0_9CHLB|nr:MULTISPECIES: glutamate racemase [Prosthecochloris]MBF0587427.1 glutamate racemase [Prosthecochloris ethylica]MBF0637618.1 glutamate racemase [Prosthecochloris ethylica]NUK48507.1 glutamate racemase [Prosthecochloris ethylica]RNA71122.1 glutamate racemase [Prosthecochloris sp. ZM_2]